MTVAMHDGLARSIVPAHTMVDGDIASPAPCRPARRRHRTWPCELCLAAELAVEAAIGTLHASTRNGDPV